ncbi:MAG: hypothetical protein IJ286_05905 [Alistipes sp.]|nr:hypothetical protein [Alistipes sp.]
MSGILRPIFTTFDNAHPVIAVTATVHRGIEQIDSPLKERNPLTLKACRMTTIVKPLCGIYIPRHAKDGI